MIRPGPMLPLLAAIALTLIACTVGEAPTSTASPGTTPKATTTLTVASPGVSPTPTDTPGLAVTPTLALRPTAAPTSAPTKEPSGTPTAPPVETQPSNFRLMISDDRNAIGDFSRLLVTIDRVGLQQGGESGGWLELEVSEEDREVDLVEVLDDAAVEIIRAQIPPGKYSKVFVHVDDVTGELESGTTTSVKLPSSKLQIIGPFEVHTGSLTTFVFDISVVAAGTEKKGIKYILKPVISQSGTGRPVEEVKPTKEARGELTLVLEGDVQAGATSVLVVTNGDGNPAVGASVHLKFEWNAGATDGGGKISIDIPVGTTEFRIRASSGDLEGEVRGEFLADATVEIDADGEELTLQLHDTPGPGSTSTLIVTDASGVPVPGASVSIKVKSQAVVTDVNGQLTIHVPDGATEVAINARLGNDRGELEVNLSQEDEPPQSTTGPLTLRLEGDPKPGATSTLVVTGTDGKPVKGALVTINGEEAGITDAQGRVEYDVPEGPDELEIEATLNGSVGELEVDLEEGEEEEQENEES